MNKVITEKNYPIRNIWFLKSLLSRFAISLAFVIIIVLISLCAHRLVTNRAYFDYSITDINIIFISVGLMFFVYLINGPIIVIGNITKRSRFHFTFDDESIIFQQSDIEQEKNVLYKNIKGLYVRQSFLDKIFGLSSLTIEDSSCDGKSSMSKNGYIWHWGRNSSRYEVIGAVGNRIHIPGLKKMQTQEIRLFIEKKINEEKI